MKIINFEKAKARKQPKGTATKHSPAVANGVEELQRQYREYAEYCNRWYEEHVVGQDENGAWVYK